MRIYTIDAFGQEPVSEPFHPEMLPLGSWDLAQRGHVEVMVRASAMIDVEWLLERTGGSRHDNFERVYSGTE